MNKVFWRTLLFLMLFPLVGCVRNQPDVIVITATFAPPTPNTADAAQNAAVQTIVAALPTATFAADGGQQAPPGETLPREYVVQPGDTLSAIAAANNISLAVLLQLNPLPNPDNVPVGTVLQLPGLPTLVGPDFRILPDRRLVRTSSAFEVEPFVSEQNGFIRAAIDIVDTQILTAAQVIERVALEFSVDARVLLALLEHQSGWLTRTDQTEEERTYAVGIGASLSGFDRNGLYRQLTWAADRLNYGYYRWKEGSLEALEFTDIGRARLNESINAATAGVQYLFSQLSDTRGWQGQVSAEGFYATYNRLFGDPFSDGDAPIVPDDLVQPALTLPFRQGETWFYTGGPHGGYGAGSAWSAIDFAPPDDLATVSGACYLSDYYVTASAAGVIARTAEGTVILDLDGDGDETTGWTVLYLHLAERDRIAAGTQVQAGERLGRPSCEGGFSNGTHMHIARRYNGEWIPADCSRCAYQPPPMNLGGWQAVGLPAQEYQGFLQQGAQRRIAEQGRNIANNEVSW